MFPLQLLSNLWYCESICFPTTLYLIVLAAIEDLNDFIGDYKMVILSLYHSFCIYNLAILL